MVGTGVIITDGTMVGAIIMGRSGAGTADGRIKPLNGRVLAPYRGEAAMKALETFAIYATPFIILGALVRIMMRRYAVDLTEIQEQAGSRRRARRIFLLGSWRTEK